MLLYRILMINLNHEGLRWLKICQLPLVAFINKLLGLYAGKLGSFMSLCQFSTFTAILMGLTHHRRLNVCAFGIVFMFLSDLTVPDEAWYKSHLSLKDPTHSGSYSFHTPLFESHRNWEIVHFANPIRRRSTAPIQSSCGRDWTPQHFPPHSSVSEDPHSAAKFPSFPFSLPPLFYDSMVERDMKFLHKDWFNPPSIQETWRPPQYRPQHLTITEWLERRGNQGGVPIGLVVLKLNSMGPHEAMQGDPKSLWINSKLPILIDPNFSIWFWPWSPPESNIPSWQTAAQQIMDKDVSVGAHQDGILITEVCLTAMHLLSSCQYKIYNVPPFCTQQGDHAAQRGGTLILQKPTHPSFRGTGDPSQLPLHRSGVQQRDWKTRGGEVRVSIDKPKQKRILKLLWTTKRWIRY